MLAGLAAWLFLPSTSSEFDAIVGMLVMASLGGLAGLVCDPLIARARVGAERGGGRPN
jgi:hypothetical protein